MEQFWTKRFRDSLAKQADLVKTVKQVCVLVSEHAPSLVVSSVCLVLPVLGTAYHENFVFFLVLKSGTSEQELGISSGLEDSPKKRVDLAHVERGGIALEILDFFFFG